MISTRKQYFLRRIYLYSLLGIGLIVTSVLTYHLTAKVVELSSANREELAYQVLVVQEGDTLWNLAQRSNLNMDTRFIVNEIMMQNSLTDALIRPGQVIYIPVNQSKQQLNNSELATTQEIR